MSYTWSSNAAPEDDVAGDGDGNKDDVMRDGGLKPVAMFPVAMFKMRYEQP